MIVEDSDVTRELLRHIVDSDPRLEVAAAVGQRRGSPAGSSRPVAPDIIFDGHPSFRE